MTNCIFALSRCAEKYGYAGPRLGPKLATATTRVFTAEQLVESRLAETAIILDRAKVASQAGSGAERRGEGNRVYNGFAEVFEVDRSAGGGFAKFKESSVTDDVVFSE